jgi:hypothetical protein
VRRVIRRGFLTVAVTATAVACASMQPPPGGAERHAPPIVLSFTPETNAVNVRVNQATIQFDEVVAERPQGASDLSGLFLISPWDGDPRVSWHRTHITIKPRHRFRPNTVYTITMLPGLSDLHNNVRRNGASLTFSTGPTIPATIIRGRIFDWVAGQAAPRAFVQVFPPNDTTLVFVAAADSNGQFILPHVAEGTYIVRGFIDANRNRKLDRTELWDTTRINVVDTNRVEILAFLHDTIGPRISEITVHDSVTLRVDFDRGLDTGFRMTPAAFTLKDKDSAVLSISGATSAAGYDSVIDAASRHRADSIFRADSVRRAAAGLGVSDTAAERRRLVRNRARRDSLQLLRRPKPSRPSPVHEVVVQLGAPLHPGTYYRLRAIDIVGLLGKSRTSDRVFSIPKPSSDSTRARSAADSAARRRRRAPLGAPPPSDTTGGQPPGSAAPAPNTAPRPSSGAGPPGLQ